MSGFLWSQVEESASECHGAALWSQCGVGIKAPLDGRHIGATLGAAHRRQQHRGENAVRTFRVGTLRSF